MVPWFFITEFYKIYFERLCVGVWGSNRFSRFLNQCNIIEAQNVNGYRFKQFPLIVSYVNMSNQCFTIYSETYNKINTVAG